MINAQSPDTHYSLDQAWLRRRQRNNQQLCNALTTSMQEPLWTEQFLLSMGFILKLGIIYNQNMGCISNQYIQKQQEGY
jgi:hypothetical protein